MKTIPPFRLKPEPLNEAAKNLPKFKWAGDNIGTHIFKPKFILFVLIAKKK